MYSTLIKGTKSKHSIIAVLIFAFVVAFTPSAQASDSDFGYSNTEMAVAGIVGAGAIAGLSIILASIFNNEQHPDNSVTITPLPKTITLYSINGATGIINETNKTIAVTVSFGTIVSDLIACFDTSTNCVVKVGVTPQASGVTSNNFTDPVTYRVIAADGTTADYIVTVTVAKSSSRAITSYSIKTPPATGIINEESEGNKTITVAVPYLTTLNDLIAIFTTTGSSVIENSTTQTSGTTRNDFTNNLTYTVIAAIKQLFFCKYV